MSLYAGYASTSSPSVVVYAAAICILDVTVASFIFNASLVQKPLLVLSFTCEIFVILSLSYDFLAFIDIFAVIYCSSSMLKFIACLCNGNAV